MQRKSGGHPWARFCASCIAAAIILVCSFGCFVWASDLRDDDTPASPASFLQMSIEIKRTARSKQLRPAQGGRCPEELLKWYPDCQVLSSRANFTVGGAIRPSLVSAAVHGSLDTSIFSAPDEMSLVGWNPVIQKVPSACAGHNATVSLVHHMNVYAYPGDVSLELGKIYSKAEVESLNLQEFSFRMLASHDKLAGRYLLPKGYGIPSSKKVMVEHHLLFPKCWIFGQEVPHSSGFDLYMTGKRRMRPAVLVGALNFNMDVQPLRGPVEWVTRISADNLLGVRAKAGDWPEILAVHLHTHDVAHTKYLEIKNADGSVAFRSKPEKAGYGLQEQSFANLADIGWPRLQLQAGQQVMQHCLFDSDHLSKPVHYGLNHGEEMCAPLLVLGGNGLRIRGTILR
eukprot:Skav213688  [mRNA]  locus=scaffold491:511853:530667:- [translate_table: standard]